MSKSKPSVQKVKGAQPTGASGHLWYAWVLPLLSLLAVPSLNDAATLPRTLLWALALLLWLGMMRAQLRRRGLVAHALPMPVLVCVGVLLGTQLLSAVNALSGLEVVLSALRWAVLAVSLWVVWDHQRRGGERAVTHWALSLWVTGLVQAAFVLGQWASGAADAPMGTQQNPNLVGTLMALSLPAAAVLVVQGGKPLRWVVLCTAPLTLLAIWASESRAALLMLLLYAVAGTAMAVRWQLGQGRAGNRRVLAAVVGVMVAAAAFGLLYVGWGRKEMPRTYRYLVEDSAMVRPGTSSIEVRMILWNKSVQMAQEHPVTGVGAGNWKLEIPRYGLKGYDAQGRYAKVFFTRPHNDLLWTLGETGWLGALGYLGLFGVLVWMGLGGGRGPLQLVRWMGGLGILGYLVDAMFGFPLERMENTVMLAAYAGFAMSGTATKAGKTLPGLGLSLLALVPALVLAVLRLPCDQATLEMRRAQDRQRYAEMQRHAEEADKPWWRLEPQTATPLGWHQAMSKVEQARAQNAAGMASSPLVREALGDLLVARELAPHNYLVLSELGSTYSALGMHREAANAYAELVNTFPDNDEGWVNLAICKFNLQDVPGVRAAMERVDPGYQGGNAQALRDFLKGQP